MLKEEQKNKIFSFLQEMALLWNLLYYITIAIVWIFLLISLSGGKKRFFHTLFGKRKVKEGLKMPKGIGKVKDPTKKILGEVEKAFEKMTKPIAKNVEKIPDLIEKNIKDTERKITKGVNDMADEATKGMNVAFKKINGFIEFFVDIFASIESYLLCGIQKIVMLPQCWYYYALEMIGKLYYLPIALIVWLFSLQEVESVVWDTLEEMDRFVYQLTSGQKTEEVSLWVRELFGEQVAMFIFPVDDDPNCPIDPFAVDARYGVQSSSIAAKKTKTEGIHLIHFPESVLDKCYRCKIQKFPKPKNYF